MFAAVNLPPLRERGLVKNWLIRVNILVMNDNYSSIDPWCKFNQSIILFRAIKIIEVNSFEISFPFEIRGGGGGESSKEEKLPFLESRIS